MKSYKHKVKFTADRDNPTTISSQVAKFNEGGITRHSRNKKFSLDSQASSTMDAPPYASSVIDTTEQYSVAMAFDGSNKRASLPFGDSSIATTMKMPSTMKSGRQPILQQMVRDQKSYPAVHHKRSSIPIHHETKSQVRPAKRMCHSNEDSVPEGLNFSLSMDSDELVDNLTKQKLDLQLRGVAERITEVLKEYEKHTTENPRNASFDAAGDRLDEAEDESVCLI